MPIEVLIFGAAAAAAGSNRVRVSVSEPVTVGAITSGLVMQHPTLGFALASPRLAVNGVFARPEHVVAPGDEVALITLVSGG